MKLELGDLLKQKQNLVAIGLIVVIVGVVGWLVYSNLFAGSGADQSTAVSPGGPIAPGLTPPGSMPGMPGMPAVPGRAATPPPGSAPGPMPPTPGAPAATVAPPAAQPGAASPAPPTAPSVPATPPPPQAAPAKSVPSAGAKTITVFGSVAVTYPSGWGVGMGASGSAAVITDGKARFEIHAPDPKATDAKSIAAKAVTSIAGKTPGSLPQGELKISGYNAYYYMAGDKRIVGIDAPTRIVLVEYAKGASFAAYSAAFDKMQSELKFR